MRIVEYRIAMPISVEEYQVGQLYTVAQASKDVTGGGEGVEIIINDPYEKENGEKGQFTHKIYHLNKKVPVFIRRIAPSGSLEVHEKAWNAYPYCKTILTNSYMKDKFCITIETWHKPDLGDEPNVHGLSEEDLAKREVEHIDITEPFNKKNAEDDNYDPTKFKSSKTGRGPLTKEWKTELSKEDNNCPQMCAYKLVTVEFKWFGLQTQVEGKITRIERRIFTNFHRQLFCTIDEWIDKTMDDIREMEAQTMKELDEERKKGALKGMSID